MWSGVKPENMAPVLTSYKIEGAEKGSKDIILKAGNRYEASVDVEDPEGGKLKYKWEIIPESTDIKVGGDKESAPPPILGLYGKKRRWKLHF
jgi:hypothetical protein